MLGVVVLDALDPASWVAVFLWVLVWYDRPIFNVALVRMYKTTQSVLICKSYHPDYTRPYLESFPDSAFPF